MRSVVGLGVCLPLVLAGCAISPTAAPTPDQGLAIQGIVRGGQQPIVGSHVYLFAANTTGYGGPGIAPSSSNASVSLLNSPGYVVTDGSGGFSITNDYSCTPDTQVYIYAVGGNPGGGTNNAAGLLAALGNCPSATHFPSTQYIVVNEVSTVAAAYAFAGFASDATHVSSSSSALAKTGIKNAFANAANLADLSTGAALATTPNGNGTAPQGEIYALANILASCINSDGTLTSPSNCYKLLNNAPFAGSSGTIPTDTATAAINIAHNPGSNVAALFGLASSSPPFATSFAQPNDFTVGLQFTAGGLADPYSVAIDGSGDAWITHNDNNVTELSSLGVPLSPVTGFTGGGLNGGNGIAIDLSGNAWIANYYTNTVTELSSSGSPVSGSPFGLTGVSGPYGLAIDGTGFVWVTGTLSPYAVTRISSTGTVQSGFPFTTGLDTPRSIAIDGNGNAWIPNASSLTELSTAGSQVGSSPFAGNGLNAPYSIAIDNSGNSWIANQGGLTPSISEFKSDGSAVSGSPFTAGGVNTPKAVAIDGAGNVWVGNSGAGTISELSSSGTAISPSTGYTPTDINGCVGIAVDGSGDVWIADPSKSRINEVIGAATPVVTPLALGANKKTLGTEP